MPTATVGLAAFELEAERSGFETQRRFLAVGRLQADRSRHLSMLLIRKMRMIVCPSWVVGVQYNQVLYEFQVTV